MKSEKEGWRDAVPFVVDKPELPKGGRDLFKLNDRWKLFFCFPLVMKDIRFALEDYMHFLKVERQLSGNTIISYKRDLDEYLDYMEQGRL